MRVGFVGLGDQGGPIASRIHGGGFPLTLWARRGRSLEPFAGTDVEIAAGPADLGRRSDVVGVCLFDAAGVREVLLGPGGVVEGMRPGGIVLVHTTLSPDEVRDIAAEVTAAGLSLLDAPVSGGNARAVEGTLTVMVGGDRQALDQVRPVLATYATDVVHLGGIGAGQTAKLLNNALFTAQLVLADDVLRIGEVLGLDPGSLARVLGTSSSAGTASRVRFDVGSLAGLAASLADAALSKDVGLLGQAMAGRPREDVLAVAERFVAAMEDARGAGAPEDAGGRAVDRR
ncbi:NAD(P)-dependent oxidoreductase [Blastococcus sp. CT_GayMR16]|uniref:NAD(P)-dependent oxidoreductase n=1 Tax=Blastococcus sp. CT_GayMR16 TaxID=2559607 RepID=UPI001074573B|nr:NAD(P)-dependent oxidoreductase [Blastococcus sp. CT_GayMR16]TFV88886.1 NAD(P)-dependent oxidoreductase [Blastococcus sp. CT_GayMR16]